MKNITTYSAKRSNPFVWLASLMMLVSVVTRVIYYGGVLTTGIAATLLRIILPILACLLIAVRLPLRGEKFFFVTVRPAMLITLYFLVETAGLRLPSGISAACWALTLIQGVLFYMTFTGRLGSKLPVLAAYAAFLAFAGFDKTFHMVFESWITHLPSYVISSCAMYLGLLFAILSCRKLPAPQEGEPLRARYGDRMDGYRIRGILPMSRIVPFIMVTRNTSDNLITDTVDISRAEAYVREKRKQGYRHFGLGHVMIAAYIRLVSEFPALNRFISGQNIFHRFDLELCMVIKKELRADADETVIKVNFDPADTAVQVYEKYDAKVQEAKDTPLDSSFDKLAGMLNYIPSFLLNIVIWLLRLADYAGVLSPELMKLSPFHGSVFFTSMGSLGIPPIYHHLYDFGNLPQFCAFGAKKTVMEIGEDGAPVKKKYLDYTWTTDERLVDGSYYAACLKKYRFLLTHPEKLDEPPETVKEDIR